MSDSSPCSSCHAGCCRAFAVPMTGADVLRLEQAGHEFWSFACRWEDPHGEIAQRYAPHLFFEDSNMPYVLCLLQEGSRTLPGTNRCHFLAEESPSESYPLGRGGCSVYHDRPAACRSFPMKFSEKKELVQLHPIHEPPRAALDNAYSLCPRPWTPEDVNSIEVAGQLAAAEYEMTFFHKIVSIWNRNPGEWTAFPDFLRIVYSNRVQIEEPDEPIILKMPTAPETTRPEDHAADDETRRAA